MRKYWIPVVLTAVFACADPDRPSGPDTAIKVFVDSDPRGADIIVDGQSTGLRTPDTLRTLSTAQHDIIARIEINGVRYESLAHLERNNTIGTLLMPLLARCGSTTCLSQAASFSTIANMRVATNAGGTLFFAGPANAGIRWPASNPNPYVANGAPLFAAANGGDLVSLGVYQYTADYPQPYFGARPFTRDANAATSMLSWIVPPTIFQTLPTARGLEIRQDVFTRQDLPDVILVRVVYRNITNRSSYRSIDPRVPANGIDYDQVYVGYGLDPDIGASGDDFVSYVPDMNLAFAYDGSFVESTFGADAAAPGVVGLRMLDAAGAQKVFMISWPLSLAGSAQPGDWFPAPPNISERTGYSIISRVPSVLPYQSTDPRVGFVPNATADYRMGVTAGPFDLPPGDSIVIRVAIGVARPAAGTYTSGGAATPPGDPTDANRQILRVVQPLIDKMRAAEAFLQ